MIVQLIPPQLVPVAQQYLRQQGMDPALFNGDGSINPVGIVGVVFDKVTIRTAITPDLVFPIAASGEPMSPAMRQLMEQVQPEVVLDGRFGPVTVSPYGTPHGQRSWLPVALVGAGVVLFIGWAVFGGRR